MQQSGLNACDRILQDNYTLLVIHSVSEKEDHVSSFGSNSRGGLQGYFSFLKMKEGIWLLLGAHLDVARAANLWLKSDSSCRSSSSSSSCLFSRPSDSDN